MNRIRHSLSEVRRCCELLLGDLDSNRGLQLDFATVRALILDSFEDECGSAVWACERCSVAIIDPRNLLADRQNGAIASIHEDCFAASVSGYGHEEYWYCQDCACAEELQAAEEEGG